MSGLKSSLISLDGQLHNNRPSKFLMQHFSCLPLTFSEFRNLCESFRALYNPSSYGSVSQFLFHKATKNDPLSHRWDAGSSLVIPSPKFFEFPWHFQNVWYLLKSKVEREAPFDLILEFSDKNVNSFWNLNTLSSKYVMRIDKLISLNLLSWFGLKPFCFLTRKCKEVKRKNYEYDLRRERLTI